MTFRVHLSDGTKHDITAATPAAATAIALKRGAGAIVTKVKLLREAKA